MLSSTTARSATEIFEEFARDVDERYISSKPKGEGKGEILYIKVHDYIYLLNKIVGVGYWSWQIVALTPHTSADAKGKAICQIIAQGKLTIMTRDGEISQDGLGMDGGTVLEYGNATSTAEAQALRRAARCFGLGLHLWTENPDPEAVPPHANETRVYKLLEALGVPEEEQTATFSRYLAAGGKLADLNPDRITMLCTVLEAENDPVLGQAFKETLDRLGFNKASERAAWLKSWQCQHKNGITAEMIRNS